MGFISGKGKRGDLVVVNDNDRTNSYAIIRVTDTDVGYIYGKAWPTGQVVRAYPRGFCIAIYDPPEEPELEPDL